MTSRPLPFHLTRRIWAGWLLLLVLSVLMAAYYVSSRQADMRATAERRAARYAAQIDGFLEARIQALTMLANSPLADQPAGWPALYTQAQAFHDSFGSHVVWADAQGHTLFNTGVPLGTPVSRLPVAEPGLSATSVALATGRPAVGDRVAAPVASQPQVAIVVPALRDGRVRHLLLVTLATSELQARVDAMPLARDEALNVQDSAGGLIAHHAPAGFDAARDVDEDWRFTAPSRLSPWTFSVEVPRSVVRQPMYLSMALLLAGGVLATWAALVSSRHMARRMLRQIGALVGPGNEKATPDIDELAAAATVMRESESRLRRMFDSAPVAMVLTSRDGVVLAHNVRFTQMFGDILDDLPDRSAWWPKADPDPAGRVSDTARWERVAKTAAVPDVQPDEVDGFRVRCKDGHDRTVRIDSTVLPDGLLSSWVDVTDWRQTERALAAALQEHKGARLAALNRMEDANTARREAEVASAARLASEARYREVFEAANVGKAVMLPDGRLEANKAFCEMLGYVHGELTGKTWQELTPADEVRTVNCHWSALLHDEGRAARFEQRYLRKDGAPVWADVSASVHRDAHHRPLYLIVTVVDISARKSAEDGLRDSEARLRLALSAAKQGWWDLDLITHETKVSPEYATMLGYDALSFQVTSASWLASLHPEDAASAAQALTDCVAGRQADFRVEFRHRTRDGRWMWLLSIGKIQARDADGRPLRMLGTHTDIDALKAAQAALRELNLTLEARVAERTSELTVANRELETFSYAVSHDLRAPLRALSGYAHALQDDFGPSLPEQAKSYLDQMARASNKMGELIDGLLALSRSTRGDLRQDRVDVSALARRRLAELAAGEPDRCVRVEVEDGLAVQGDERMIASALVNLLDNAWKYTGATTDASIRVCWGEVGGLRGFCVVDNGAGFDMAHAADLFKPFKRLHRQDQFPGIGIGLATVQRIVHRHGGEIAAQAAPGQGASFCVALPQVSGGQLPATSA